MLSDIQIDTCYEIQIQCKLGGQQIVARKKVMEFASLDMDQIEQRYHFNLGKHYIKTHTAIPTHPLHKYKKDYLKYTTCINDKQYREYFNINKITIQY